MDASGAVVVPGLNDTRTLSQEHSRELMFEQEQQERGRQQEYERQQQMQQQQQQQQQEWEQQQHRQAAHMEPEPRALRQTDRSQEPPPLESPRQAHPDSPCGYVPGPVTGICSGSYESAGSRQEEQLIGRSSTRLLAPPGGASSLGISSRSLKEITGLGWRRPVCPGASPGLKKSRASLVQRLRPGQEGQHGLRSLSGRRAAMTACLV